MNKLESVKKGRATWYTYNDYECRSKEEAYFLWYLLELQESGYVRDFEYENSDFKLGNGIAHEYVKQLKTKKKWCSESIMGSHEYTPDFIVNFQSDDMFFVGDLGGRQKLKGIYPFMTTPIMFPDVYVEIKGMFDRNNMTRLFRINQKWIWEKYRIYIQEIQPMKLFKETFTPERFLFTDKSMKARKMKYKPKTLQKYIEEKGHD